MLAVNIFIIISLLIYGGIYDVC